MFMKYLLSVFLELLGAVAVTTATAVPEEDTVGTEVGGRLIDNAASAYLSPLTSNPEAYSTLSNSF